MPRILATADIGSNTIHLLVAEVEDGSVVKILDASEWIGLGEIVGRMRCIPAPAQEPLIRTLREYRKSAAENGAEKMYVFATEALRTATNGQEVVKRVGAAAGIKPDLITSKREAEFGFQGASIDVGGSDFLLVDMGGGSAQFSRCSRKRVKDSASLPLGTGTLNAKLGLSSPCDYAHMKRMQRSIEDAIKELSVFDGAPMVAGCGGVVRGLWRALHPDGSRVLHLQEIEYLIWATQRLTVDEIVNRFQVKPKRAQTLLPGAILYKAILERSRHEEITVSRFGVREGAILEMDQGKVQGWPV